MSLTADEVAERIAWSCPPRYRTCRFETFDAYTPELAERLSVVRRAAQERRSIFLFGPVGTGKTHLAVSTMAVWIGRGASGRFVSAVEFACRVTGSFGNAAAVFSDLIDPEYDRFALLDDLGAERSSESARAALFYFIDRIYRDGSRLIVTSNLSPPELGKWEPRLMSRIAEMCVTIELRAEDFRLRTARSRKSSAS